MSKSRKIIYKTPEQINNIRKSGRYLTELLGILYDEVSVGVSLLDLENIAEDFMIKNKIKGAFKWYSWFPANLCLSVNDCVVHGIPDDYILKSGDLLKVDCGVTYQKWISDAAFSIVVGGELANPAAHGLIVSTKNALDQSLKSHVVPNKMIYNFSRSVQQYIKADGFAVIQNLTWHGVWVAVHEAPHIYNYPHPDTKKAFFKENMVVALEPITALSSRDTIEKSGNPRNLYTQNGDLWAQWEYTILITANGYEILAWLPDMEL